MRLRLLGCCYRSLLWYLKTQFFAQNTPPMNDVLELRKYKTTLNYQADLDKITQFILFYSEEGSPKYLPELKSKTICIDLEDVALFDETGLANRIQQNTITYLGLFYKAIDSILFNSDELFLEDEEDVFFYHRIARLKEKHPTKKATDVFPAPLLRNYTILFRSRSNYYCSIREVKSNDIGRLIRIRGVLTRISQVKPFVQVCTYVCESCGSETYQMVSNNLFDALEECQSDKCKIRALKGTLHLQTRGSKFVKYQSLQVQELTSDVPRGCVPRVMNVECYENVDLCRPGDYVRMEGVFLPRPYHGFKKMKAGLLTDTFFYAMTIDTKDEPAHGARDCAQEGRAAGECGFGVRYCENSSVVDKMAHNIAPEIYGMEDVKKILLLMLAGAPSKTKRDGMRIRGDVNVLLLGDPGIAKSQLLKTVAKISKRGVYTTGRGTSGVGLTAGVAKDPLTGEMVLEGGALVLSDGGICCIDELDKMSENDRVSIHEVMEQQTVSISKAGINTTLNARCGVLGAANPVKGRYNTRKSIEHNVGLPCALLSRFDVLVILKDEADTEKDMMLANHITSLHMEEKPSEISYAELRDLVEECKKITPTIPKFLSKRLSDSYVEARKRNAFLTPRYLLSLIRLSLAHARLRFAHEVCDVDVDEAIRLMEVCRSNIPDKKEDQNPRHALYNLIVSLGDRVALKKLYEMTCDRFRKEDIDECIREFEELGVWAVEDDYLVIFN